MKTKAAIFGASGYTGQELIRILSGHPQVELAAVTSRRYAGVKVSDVFPSLAGLTFLTYTDASPREIAGICDVVFLALPHGVSMEIAPVFLEAGKKVIDLSADYRLRDPATYEEWYAKHSSAGLFGQAVYGLPELYRDAVKTSSLIANPGCYPTSIILGLAPALKNKLLDVSTIIADSASGVSGAGRDPAVGSLFCEADGGFKAYKVGKHRHTPEIEQELNKLAGEKFFISFTPHLLPVKRGILSTMYASLRKEATQADLHALYASFYAGEKFIRICSAGTFPNLSSVCGSNYCDIGLTVDPRTRRVIIISAIDNLVKGAAGQAVQNMNLVCALPEDSGLGAPPLYP
ncbi:MAG: N-acetyl-gamma-glutamyl-phosphate reductase [Smithellaceae bacterium]|jgi:N-acetyl-gamma-glutamyl-phosphate reductase|nr:N-acetyl-gamma-glutamyl-phosphate reductase [Smithellaceae bacterium]MDD3257849.1 N-acetyl-gamma-glutamyl-phosphate reductase [Smithellaceae bacterium]MDD3847799.1 N-acetyl-gamma-glutamyl-phosphate reductase [Smithellaceae bacterium]HOG13393.1 N-acetyl-gamma-glutamyl-phosphate reductase [Smithellaceae bacterium]HPL09398.1 N-acetyl-gamma-glutamyl-phosphate reductase [Smithellaceae bacterium]